MKQSYLPVIHMRYMVDLEGYDARRGSKVAIWNKSVKVICVTLTGLFFYPKTVDKIEENNK